MKLWILSDLHIESCVWDLPSPYPDYDVLIAAGDIHDPASHGVDWLAERAGGKPVIYVPGNHEWIAPRMNFTVQSETSDAKALAAKRGVNFLMDEAVIIDGVRFLGATLWTDWALHENVGAAMGFAAMTMPDHSEIYPDDSYELLSPRQTLEWHRTSRAWLESQLWETGDWVNTVVVTHHLPHPSSVSPRFKGGPLSPAFASDLSELVENCGAALWVHGHTHDSFDYQAGSTRIVCNPKGYGPKGLGLPIENKAFDPMFVVEVEV